MSAVVSEVPVPVMEHGLGAARRERIRTDPVLPPARLTPRGRIVVTAVVALLIAVASVVLATAAQATHSGSSSPGRYVAKVMVLPGQSLWSVAQEYDPDADPRAAMQQIQQLNSLSGDQLQAGQVLWVPRS